MRYKFIHWDLKHETNTLITKFEFYHARVVSPELLLFILSIHSTIFKIKAYPFVAEREVCFKIGKPHIQLWKRLHMRSLSNPSSLCMSFSFKFWTLQPGTASFATIHR